MERELAELIKPLPLSEEVISALLERKGVLGRILSCALACEVADFDYENDMEFQPRDFFAVNLEAIEWADAILETL